MKSSKKYDLTTPQGRLRFFAKVFYGSVNSLGQMMNYDHLNTATGEKSERKVPVEHMSSLYEAGCSLDWYLEGKGDVLSHSDEGKMFKKRLKSNPERYSMFFDHINIEPKENDNNNDNDNDKSSFYDMLMNMNDKIDAIHNMLSKSSIQSEK